MRSWPKHLVLPYGDNFLRVLMFDACISADWPKKYKILYSQSLAIILCTIVEYKTLESVDPVYESQFSTHKTCFKPNHRKVYL